MPGCPLKEVDPGCNFWLALFPSYEEGILWEPGGLGDQPLQYLQAMNVIRIIRDEIVAEKQKEAEDKAKRERDKRR